MAEHKIDEFPVEESTNRDNSDAALSDLVRSTLHAGLNLALVPIALLPEDSQAHLRRAGSEFTMGLSAILRSASEALNTVAEEI